MKYCDNKMRLSTGQMNNALTRGRSLRFLPRSSKLFCLLVFFILINAYSFGQNNDPYDGIIPAPVEVNKANVNYVLDKNMVIKIDSLTDPNAVFLKDYLKNKYGLRATLSTKTGSIVLDSKGAQLFRPEEYTLTVTDKNVIIVGKPAGLFYGIQSFIQLLPIERSTQQPISISGVSIKDYPRFSYRGFLLDVARHFFTVSEVEHVMDIMASYKLNILHLHLSDDQAWRVEIKKYPKLVQTGNDRTRFVINGNDDWFTGISTRGYYTQVQIKHLVDYGIARHITIIPEIDMPGHSGAALRAYPAMKFLPAEKKIVKNDQNVYLPTEKTFSFLEGVLDEIMQMFPSKYIMVGGDEVNKTFWKQSAFAQKLIKEKHLKDEDGLQSYFIHRINDFIVSKGRKLMGWEQILQGGAPRNSVIVSVTDQKFGIEGARLKHEVIFSPHLQGMYFDYAQSKSIYEPPNFGWLYGGLGTLEEGYNLEPIPSVLTPEEGKYVIGVEGCLWTEFVATLSKVEFMMLPRLLALSEVAWSPEANKNYNDFSKVRLPKHLLKFDKAGYNYHVPTAITPVDTLMIGDTFCFKFDFPVAGSKIYYTIDGSVPGYTDMEIKPGDSLTFILSKEQKKELRTIVITPSGKRSVPTSTKMWNGALKASVEGVTVNRGLKYRIMQGTFNNIDQLTCTGTPIDSGIVQTIDPSTLLKDHQQPCAVVYDGFINVKEDGVFKFYLKSDDIAEIAIDKALVVKYNRSVSIYEKESSVPLKKGLHYFKLSYINAGSAAALSVRYSGPDKQMKVVGSDCIFFLK